MDDEASDDSVRARRAQRAKRGPGERIGEFAKRNLKAYAVVTAVLLVAMGVYALALPKPKAPTEEKVHNHAGFEILVGDDILDLHKCAFMLEGCDSVDGTHYLAGHLHYSEPLRYLLHIEHPVSAGNLTLARYMDRGLGFHLTNTSLQLDTRVYDGRLIENNATHTWQLWVEHCVKKPLVWERLHDITGYIPQQHDRFVLAYTDKTLDELTPTFEKVPTDEQMLEARAGSCPVVKGIYSFVPNSSSPSG